MSDQQQQLTPEQIQANLAQMMAQVIAQQQARAGTQLQPQMEAQLETDWQPQPAPMEQIKILRVNIPLNLKTPAGKLRVYFEVDGSAAANLGTLMAVIKSMYQKGMPLDFWKGGDNWSKDGGKQW